MQNLARFLTQTSRRFGELALSIAAVLAMVLCCLNASAQSGAGSIQGTVTDATGAVIGGASIHVLNQATNEATDTTSTNVGYYQVPGLNTGTYVISVSAPGMKTSKQTIELLVAQNAVINMALSPGSVTQQVTVNANVVQLVTTDNGSVTATLENAKINELPMNGRNIISLVNETTPGLESCPESGSCANGQEGPSTEYVTDGASLANREFGGVHEGSTQMVDPDAVQEVRVEDTAAGAQYALPTTVILNTKSGTNELHGSLFETARNNDFGIARTRNEQSSYSQPEYIRNEFGASMGGPIVIPHIYHGKNKSFFFFAYERYSLAQIASQNENAPTAAMRSGDFSGLVSSAGILQQLYNPYTTNLTGSTACREPASAGTASPSQQWCRTAFAGNPNGSTTTNYIPSSLESPATVILNEMTPQPTNANNPLVKNNLIGLVPELQVEPQITFRLDHEFNENNRAYLRYTQNINTSISPRNDPVDESYTLAVPSAGIPAGVSGIAYSPDATFAAAFGFTHVFSPTFYSETVLSDSWMGEQNYAGGSPFTDWESKFGFPNNFAESGFPYIESIFQPMDGTQFQYGMTWTIPQIDENLNKVLGKHQLQFGGRFRFERLGSRPDEIKDSINFGNGEDTGLENPTSGSKPAAYTNTGQLNADEYLGGADSYGVNLEPPYQHFHDMEIDGYFQDNYRVRPTLTVNLGLRWEAHPAEWVGQGAMMGFDLKNDAMVTSGPTSQLIAEGLTTQAIINNDILDDAKFETPSQAGMPTMLVNSYDFNFSPRLGAAWQVFPKTGTVLRGALGRYIYPNPIREGYRDVDRNNPFTAGYSDSYTSAGYAPDNLQNYMLRAQPSTSSSYTYLNTAPGGAGGTPIMGLNSANVVNSASPNAITPGLGIVSINPIFPPSFVDEADLTVEQPLKWNSVLRVSYIYTHGTNLNNSFFYNDHPSEYSWEVQTGTETPTGTASVVSTTNTNTGEGPYDNLTYGSGNYQIQKSGWSNYNALQVNYQKLYHAGSAWQVMYSWAKNLRTGGDYGGESGDNVEPYVNFVNSGPATVTVAPSASSASPLAPVLPPPPPAGVLGWQYYKALNRWENYTEDSNTPAQHIQFNGLLDFPFGRGKRWLSGANKPLNEIVGGWQLASAGRFTVSYMYVNTTNWGPTSPIKVYKHSAPITDCRSGVCLKSYEWFNGYIAPTANAGAACTSNCVSGLPNNWQSYQTPMDTTPGSTYYGDNEVVMNGVTGQTANTNIPYGDVPANNDNGSSESTIDVTNPYGHTALHGPWNWSTDASLFKVFPITGRLNLRMNVDAFNVFNNQGLPTPSTSDGTVCVTPGGLGCSSSNAGRQLQFTARLNF